MKVHKRKAGKDYPEQGIAKGETYYTWHPKGANWQRQKTAPTPRQLTANAWEHFLMDTREGVEALGMLEREDLESAIEELASLAREKGDEEDEKFNNLPESLQDSSTGELLQERRDLAYEIADSLENIDLDEDRELEEIQQEIDSVLDVF